MTVRPIVLLCPKVPPTRDGVGDYTSRLASELAKRHRVVIVTTEGQQPVDAGCPVLTVRNWNADGLSSLWPILEGMRPLFINVQWVPFLWGRWGVNLALPLMVLRLCRAGHRLVITVHEPYVSFDMWRRLPMAVVQRLELWLMILGSAKVAVTISAWTRMLQSRFFWRERDIFWLPVGSNIPVVCISDDERTRLRRELGVGEHGVLVVMFNPRGTGKMLALSERAWAAIRLRHPSARLVLIGCEERDLAAGEFSAREQVICAGYLDPLQVSRCLSSADLCLAPYIDGVSARRGSVMAAMEHGVPTVSTRGFLTDRGLFDESPLVLTEVGNELEFIAAGERLASDPASRRHARSALPAFYREHFAWPLIAHRLLQHGLTEVA
jgi:glycosyltransferase involved in cell wall biosynthesis